MKKIMCVLTQVKGRFIYVQQIAKRPDGKYTVSTSFNENDAMDFRSPQNALRMIDEFFNPFERSYAAKSIDVVRSYSQEGEMV